MRNENKVCLVVIINLITASVFCQDIQWTEKPEMPVPVSKAKAAYVDGKIFIIGGISPQSKGFSTSNYEYDLKSGSWTRKKDIPEGRINYAVAVVKGEIYVIGDVIGGLENLCCPPFPEKCDWKQCTRISDKNEVFDPATGLWKTLNPMTTPRHGLDIIAVNGKVYAIGGMGNNTSMWAPLSIVEEYSPETDTWTTKKEMPTPRDGYGYSVQNDMIYLFGGWVTDQEQTKTTIVYNTKSNNWTFSDDIPIKTGACAYATAENKIYFFGGDKEDYTEIYSCNYEGIINKR